MSLAHWLVVIVIALLLFGRGKISDLMGDLAKGIKSFKKGMAEDDDVPAASPPSVTRTTETDPTLIEHEPVEVVEVPEPAPAVRKAAAKKAAAPKTKAAPKAKAKS